MDDTITDEVYWDLANFIERNPELTTNEIIQDFKSSKEFKFTSEKSFLYLMNRIDRNRQSFWGIGPFMNKNGKWINVRNKKKEHIVVLTEANKQLKDKILDLQLELFQYKNRKNC
ncbi:MAG: hypothetical protein CXT73_04575 [Methanobacteriota archaeon]|nr:MAG: hypothetical protein CXT73_04575 [Euryarchaeota archaeon]